MLQNLNRGLRLSAAAALVACAPFWLGDADAASLDILKGKSVRVVLSGGPGTGTDQYGRVFVEALERALPDTEFLLQNLDGGGGALAITEIENSSGSTIAVAVTNTGPIYNQLLDSKLAIDLTRFHWLGSLTSNQRVAVVPAKLGKSTVEDLKTVGRQLIAVSSEAGSANAIESLAISAQTGLNLRVVSGLKEPQRMTMLLAGDADFMVGSFVNFETLIANGELVPVLQYVGSSEPASLASVPTLREILPGEESAQIVGLFEMLDSLGRYAIAAPDTDPEIVDALRQAFEVAAADPKTKESFEKSKLVLGFTPGTKVQEMIATYLGNPEAGKALARAVACGTRKSEDPAAACE